MISFKISYLFIGVGQTCECQCVLHVCECQCVPCMCKCPYVPCVCECQCVLRVSAHVCHVCVNAGVRHVCVSAHVCHVCECQCVPHVCVCCMKRALSPLELGLQIASCLTWVMGCELESLQPRNDLFPYEVTQ